MQNAFNVGVLGLLSAMYVKCYLSYTSDYIKNSQLLQVISFNF